jgi:hypothetical protein
MLWEAAVHKNLPLVPVLGQRQSVHAFPWEAAVHKNLPLVPVLGQRQSVHAFPSSLRSVVISSTHLRLGPTGWLCSFPQENAACSSHTPQTCHMSYPPHTPWSYHTDIWRGLQIIKLAISQVSLFSCYFFLLWPKYVPQHLNITLHKQNGTCVLMLGPRSASRPTCWRRLKRKYSSAIVSTGNTFQDLPRLHETADNTESYILRDIRVTYEGVLVSP